MASEPSTPVTVSTRACAKINLALRLTGRRPDGYHELRTVLQSIALHDTLRFRTTRGPFRIECDDPTCPTDRTNLVWRAADAMWRAAGRRGLPRGVVVTIEKRIPIAAGLGGGSSDAAAAIRGLSRVWRVDLPRDRQQTIAASLGADVPFFLRGGTALGVGRGDIVLPMVDVPAAWVVLVIPPFGVSTRDAYAWWDAAHRGASHRPALQSAPGVSGAGFTATPALSLAFFDGVLHDPGRAGMAKTRFGNDLEAAVSAHHPEIARIVRGLRRRGATFAAMSGSGSGVFGLFASKAAADRAARSGAARFCRALITRTVGRSAYRRLGAVTSRDAGPDLPRKRPLVYT